MIEFKTEPIYIFISFTKDLYYLIIMRSSFKKLQIYCVEIKIVSLEDDKIKPDKNEIQKSTISKIFLP